MTTRKVAAFGAVLSALAGAGIALTTSPAASAQEILLTGPLAGAPAVRKLRLYRDHRWEVAPTVSFSLLDAYQRTLLAGVKAGYNITDWFAAEVWGAYGILGIPTHLTEETQDKNAKRRVAHPDGNDINSRATAANLGPNFENQIGKLEAVIAVQATAVPFRGKLSLFQGVYLDTDLYFFAGPAAVRVGERRDCGPRSAGNSVDCTQPQSFERVSRWTIAPTFGLGLTMFVNGWNSLQVEWRALPISWNTSGFSIPAEDGKLADSVVDENDREFQFEQMVTFTYNFYLPQEYRVSE